MIEATVAWTDHERFLGAATSGHALVIDAASNKTSNKTSEKTANSPMELVLLGLCGCTASDVIGILRKKRQPFAGLEVHASAERSDDYPSVYTAIKLIYRVRGKVDPKAMEDAVKLSKEKYCSVSAMLQKTARITFEIEYVS